MKILFVLCPPFWTKLPPLGIASLVSFLGVRGYHCDVWDINIECYHRVSSTVKKRWLMSCDLAFQDSFFDALPKQQIDSLVDAIMAGGYTVICFSVFRSNRVFSMRLAQELWKQQRDIQIIFGGPEILAQKNSYQPFFSRDMCDYVSHMVIGEGEMALLSLLEGIRNDVTMPFYIDSDEIALLDSLPIVDYGAFDLSRYERTRALPLLSSRGCIRSCAFCAEHLLSKSYRERSVAHIIREIEYDRATYDTVWFTFHDSLINASVSRLQEFCELLIKRELHIKWDAQAIVRPDMDVRLFALMRKAGCFNLFVGLESGSDAQLRRMNKTFTRSEARFFFEQCAAADLHCEVSLIVGFPEESDDDFEDTLSFLAENRRVIPKIAQINTFVPYPGIASMSDERRRHTLAYMNTHEAIMQTRFERLIRTCDEYNYRYTPSFIGNVRYE